jgi:hypothetical protein
LIKEAWATGFNKEGRIASAQNWYPKNCLLDDEKEAPCSTGTDIEDKW